MTHAGTGDACDDGVDARLRRLGAYDLPPVRARALRDRCRSALSPQRRVRARVDATLRLALPAAAAVLSFGLVMRVVHDALAILGLL